PGVCPRGSANLTHRVPHRRAWVLCVSAMCLSGLAACRSLPTITPDMAPVHALPQLEGAHGPLSPARSKAVLDALKARAHDTNLLDRHLAVEEALADHPLVAGNKVTLLQDGDATYAA